MFESDQIYACVPAGETLPDENSSLFKVYSLIAPRQRVLDVGCGAGRLARLLRDKGVTVVGIERHREAAALAREYCERVLEIDVAEAGALLAQDSFDAIVCADVLEHLDRPDLVVRSLLPRLREGGILVVSLPNIAHYTCRARLLCGRFDYQPWGVMDRTHLRFFTRETALALLAEVGLLPSVIDAVYAVPFGRLSTLWRGYAPLVGSLAPALFAYQWIIVGAKTSPASPSRTTSS